MNVCEGEIYNNISIFLYNTFNIIHTHILGGLKKNTIFFLQAILLSTTTTTMTMGEGWREREKRLIINQIFYTLIIFFCFSKSSCTHLRCVCLPHTNNGQMWSEHTYLEYPQFIHLFFSLASDEKEMKIFITFKYFMSCTHQWIL